MSLVVLSFYSIEYFFINTMMLCTLYFKYVQCEIKSLKDDLDAACLNDELIRKKIYKIVKIHNTGIELGEQLEKVTNFTMLVLYALNTAVLCVLFIEFHIVRFHHHL